MLGVRLCCHPANRTLRTRTYGWHNQALLGSPAFTYQLTGQAIGLNNGCTKDRRATTTPPADKRERLGAQVQDGRLAFAVV